MLAFTSVSVPLSPWVVRRQPVVKAVYAKIRFPGYDRSTDVQVVHVRTNVFGQKVAHIKPFGPGVSQYALGCEVLASCLFGVSAVVGVEVSR